MSFLVVLNKSISPRIRFFLFIISVQELEIIKIYYVCTQV